jgi:hypothetical protein
MRSCRTLSSQHRPNQMNARQAMKSKPTATVLMFVCVMSFAVHSAQAFYNPSTGRWLNRDPIGNEGFIRVLSTEIDDNELSTIESTKPPYLFVENLPILTWDVNGLWPSRNHWLLYRWPKPQTHENSIFRTLPEDLPDRPLASLILTFATLEVDDDQSVAGSPKHAMTAPWQSKARAKQDANAFVRGHIVQAQELLCACSPNMREALHQSGLALHTIQDGTSPSHFGFQTWYSPLTDPIGANHHLRREGFDPGPDSELDKASRWLWTFFKCRNDSPPFPSDFFSNLKQDERPW